MEISLAPRSYQMLQLTWSATRYLFFFFSFRFLVSFPFKFSIIFSKQMVVVGYPVGVAFPLNRPKVLGTYLVGYQEIQHLVFVCLC